MIAQLIAKLRVAAGRRFPQHLLSGQRGERLAYAHLKREGYRVIARNFRARHSKGEIDILGWDGDQLACVEVKTRKTADFGRPERFVGQEKRRHLIRAAHEFARRVGVETTRLRFDIVSITLEPEVQIELLRNAFSDRPGQWGHRF